MMSKDKSKFIALTILYFLFPICFFLYQSDWYFDYGMHHHCALFGALDGLIVFWCITWVCCVLYILNVIDVRPFDIPLNRFPT